MKEVLDYRLEVAAMRGLRVKALKVSREELHQLTAEPWPTAMWWGGWSYKNIPLQVLDRA